MPSSPRCYCYYYYYYCCCYSCCCCCCYSCCCCCYSCCCCCCCCCCYSCCCCCYCCCCYSCCSDWIGKLRVFGNGENKISFCHVDNYCHGLILGAKALYPGSPALGQKLMTFLLFREIFCFKSYCIGYFLIFSLFLFWENFSYEKLPVCIYHQSF